MLADLLNAIEWQQRRGGVYMADGTSDRLGRSVGPLLFRLLLSGLALVTLVASAEAADQAAHLFMPDRQVKSHAMRLYLTEGICS